VPDRLGGARPAEACPLLGVEAVSKSYGAARALREVSLALFPGEVHGLVGEGDSGKSALVEALSGVRLVSPGDLAATVARAIHDVDAPAREQAAVAAADPLAPFATDEADLPDGEAEEEIEEGVDEELDAAASEANRRAVQGWGDLGAPPNVPPVMAIPAASYVSAAEDGKTGTDENAEDDGNGSALAPAAEATPAADDTESDGRPPRGLLSRDELSALLEDYR